MKKQGVEQVSITISFLRFFALHMDTSGAESGEVSGAKAETGKYKG